MKKVIYSVCAVALVTLAVVNVNLAVKSEGGSNLTLANILALANIENPGSGESNENCNNCGSYKMLDCEWTYIEYMIDAGGKKVVLKRTKKTCKNCAYNCDFNKTGNCQNPVLCKTDEEVEV